MKKTPPGQVTIVDFVDFECPYCRQTAADLAPTLDKYKGKFRLVRKEMPLKRIHPHALAAARAECCAEDMGQGDRMADEMMSVKPEELTDDGCAAHGGAPRHERGGFPRVHEVDPKTTQRTRRPTRRTSGPSTGTRFRSSGSTTRSSKARRDLDALRQAMEKALAEVGS